MNDPTSISPTAHYTGHIWVRNGLSHPELATGLGRAMYLALEPTMRLSRGLGGPSLEPYLLARHRAIDTLLGAAVERGGITQIVEVAAGMSPRGWRFARRYGADLLYVEADLPAMAQAKAGALARMEALGADHRVEAIDALRPGGEGSLSALLGRLDPGRSTAVVTEGLLNYLTPAAVRDLWQRMAEGLGRFPAGRYVSDLVPGSARSPLIDLATAALGVFVRGRVGAPFADAAETEAQLRRCGFASARLVPAQEILGARDAPGTTLAQVIDAQL